MTFEEVGQQYATLRQQRDAGQLPDAAFRQMVAQLVAADAQGNYWQLNADTAQWEAYGTAQSAYPPVSAPAAAYAQTSYARPEPQAAPRKGLSQGTWDVISVVGNAILSAGWFLYSGMADTKPDYLTCGAMLVLPISLVVFRKPLDNVLRAIQPWRSKIPQMVLAGCCVAIPYLVSNYLYLGMSQFTFMFASYVLSTAASFILLRQPSPQTGQQAAPGGPQRAGAI